MAKKQTFADKSKGKAAVNMVNVKVVKTVQQENGAYKFQERFVQLEDINQVTNIK